MSIEKIKFKNYTGPKRLIGNIKQNISDIIEKPNFCENKKIIDENFNLTGDNQVIYNLFKNINLEKNDINNLKSYVLEKYGIHKAYQKNIDLTNFDAIDFIKKVGALSTKGKYVFNFHDLNMIPELSKDDIKNYIILSNYGINYSLSKIKEISYEEISNLIELNELGLKNLENYNVDLNVIKKANSLGYKISDYNLKYFENITIENINFLEGLIKLGLNKPDYVFLKEIFPLNVDLEILNKLINLGYNFNQFNSININELKYVENINNEKISFIEELIKLGIKKPYISDISKCNKFDLTKINKLFESGYKTSNFDNIIKILNSNIEIETFIELHKLGFNFNDFTRNINSKEIKDDEFINKIKLLQKFKIIYYISDIEQIKNLNINDFTPELLENIEKILNKSKNRKRLNFDDFIDILYYTKNGIFDELFDYIKNNIGDYDYFGDFSNLEITDIKNAISNGKLEILKKFNNLGKNIKLKDIINIDNEKLNYIFNNFKKYEHLITNYSVSINELINFSETDFNKLNIIFKNYLQNILHDNENILELLKLEINDLNKLKDFNEQFYISSFYLEDNSNNDDDENINSIEKRNSITYKEILTIYDKELVNKHKILSNGNKKYISYKEYLELKDISDNKLHIISKLNYKYDIGYGILDIKTIPEENFIDLEELIDSGVLDRLKDSGFNLTHINIYNIYEFKNWEKDYTEDKYVTDKLSYLIENNIYIGIEDLKDIYQISEHDEKIRDFIDSGKADYFTSLNELKGEFIDKIIIGLSDINKFYNYSLEELHNFFTSQRYEILKDYTDCIEEIDNVIKLGDEEVLKIVNTIKYFNKLGIKILGSQYRYNIELITKINQLQNIDSFINSLEKVKEIGGNYIDLIYKDLAIKISEINNPKQLDIYLKDLENTIGNNSNPDFISKFKMFGLFNNEERLIDIVKNGELYNGAYEGKVRSPTLKNIAENDELSDKQKYKKLMYTVLKDIIHTNLNSGNTEFLNYLKQIKKDSYVLSNYSNFSKEEINNSLKNLETLYSTILVGENNFINTDFETEKRIENIKKRLNVKDNDFETAINNFFVKNIDFKNIENIDGLINYLENFNSNQEKKYKEIYNNASIIENDKYLNLNKGDYLHGTGDEILQYLDKNLDNGIYCKELLPITQKNLEGDRTKLDVDMIKIEGDFNSNKETIEKSLLNEMFGDLLWVFDGNSLEKNYEIFLLGEYISGGNGANFIGKSFDDTPDYGIRNSIGSGEIKYMIAKPEISENITKLTQVFLHIVKKGYYIPVCDINGKIIFNPEQFQKLKNDINDEINISQKKKEITSYFPKNFKYIGKYREILDDLNDYNEDLGEFKNEIIQKIKLGFLSAGIKNCEKYIKITETGSNSRKTATGKNVDFDFMIEYDKSLNNDIKKIISSIHKILATTSNGDGDSDNRIRSFTNFYTNSGFKSLKGENIEGIDISFTPKNNLDRTSSNELLELKLKEIKKHYGEQNYKEVLGNIILAKKLLKEHKVYKKAYSKNSDGIEYNENGLGGIGIENWIINSKGSFHHAGISFLKTAFPSGDFNEKPLDFNDFRKHYMILDLGNNLVKNQHDNFIDNLGFGNPSGYEKMINALKNIFFDN